MRNVAAEGIDILCYNFMPIVDWTRTDLEFEWRDGSKALKFDASAFAAFDIFILGNVLTDYNLRATLSLLMIVLLLLNWRARQLDWKILQRSPRSRKGLLRSYCFLVVGILSCLVGAI